MDDFAWFIAVGVLLVLLGTVFAWLGLAIWKKRRIDLIIRRHVEKVREEDKPAYCALAGTGVLAVGIGFALTGLCAPLLRSALAFAPMAAGLAAGIALLILAGIRYNR